MNKFARQVSAGILLASFAAFGVACSNESPKLVGEPPRETRKSEGAELQTFNPTVDILFVIDDSGSMYSHQRNLQANADLFAAGLQSNKFVDYHIGVISTSEQYSSWQDSGGGVLYGRKRFIDRNTLNGLQELKDNIMIGTNGSGWEMIFQPIKMALTDPVASRENAGFYRPSAYLAIVVITDAEDQSRLEASETVQFLVDLKKGDSNKILTYGVIIPSTDRTGCTRDDSRAYPVRLEEFFNLTKGSYYGLCDPDYGTKLGNIGKDLVERVGRKVLLDRRPIIDTIEVVYGSQKIDPDPVVGWSFDATENAIILGRGIVWTDQPAGTVVEVFFKPADAQ